MGIREMSAEGLDFGDGGRRVDREDKKNKPDGVFLLLSKMLAAVGLLLAGK
jgi:hypothetical protein